MRHYQLSTINYYLALAGLWENGGVPTPAVALHLTAFTPLAGLRAKNKNFTDRFRFS
ncbi:MAG: hypothetical protein LBE12_20005 [Planctomycetaceae bacterium]|nr:hypothetical protein [Planctomycetaceae bacterium]